MTDSSHEENDEAIPRTLENDPLEGSLEVAEFFGPTYGRVRGFAELLADQGVLRGLIGPRELERIWERHILNSAAIAPFLGAGTLVDVGSGAGLPGMVIAAMEPDRRVILVEPMERRVQWLLEASRNVGIENVIVVRGRAEEVRESVEGDIITARAVASVDKLIKWCAPLLAPEGHMVLLKGRSAADELERAKYALRKHRMTGEVLEAGTLEGLEPTRVVRLSRQAKH
ncbi:16S rRNA (guanine(527)-N(7))-methyltransferase RsmG [Demequina capsici]|uniref:Ribosomal RNA small subunit methyltransferase G n=1 Tax=Demequina capsici TaxID=3075620 RepID=A0AA96JFW8_9MICO|nr:16S rRNA (guanine(527)-N(7))-methyltransferase RsmG [Demequina sp. PMTSA13]WNM27314.1 16S rRNA (guanine(527)-N(7))-methyltransferase RsmG [Demequina sp. PMTSA13]